MVQALLLILMLFVLPEFGAAKAPSKPNVLLITIDTLRVDHLSCYGYHLETTPVIDKLAADGVRFENAYTTIPLTGPSHIALLSGRYPQENGARINGRAFNRNAKLLFLPQILRKFGYRTAAFISGWPLTSRLTHLDRFFDLYDEDLPRTYQMFNSMRFASDVTPRAMTWLKANHHRPFFLWVHYFDPHAPYHLRKGFEHLKEIGKSRQAEPAMDRGMRRRVRRYDSEVAYADYYIGKLLAELDALKLRDSTLVVLLADHGESLGEHGYVGHGRHLFQGIVRVPLVVRFPGVVKAGKVVPEEVSLIDLSPTIIDLALKRADPALHLPVEWSGRSFAKALVGPQQPREETVRFLTFGGKKGFFPNWMSFLWTNPDSLPLHIGSVTGSRKVIWTPANDSIRIYDLARDPLEMSPFRPKSGSEQQRIESARLEHWYNATEGAAGENTMTEKDIKILKSLGYIR